MRFIKAILSIGALAGVFYAAYRLYLFLTAHEGERTPEALEDSLGELPPEDEWYITPQSQKPTEAVPVVPTKIADPVDFSKLG